MSMAATSFTKALMAFQGILVSSTKAHPLGRITAQGHDTRKEQASKAVWVNCCPFDCVTQSWRRADHSKI